MTSATATMGGVLARPVAGKVHLSFFANGGPVTAQIELAQAVEIAKHILTAAAAIRGDAEAQAAQTRRDAQAKAARLRAEADALDGAQP